MRRAVAVALVALAALLGACGGSSSGNGSDDTNTTLDCSAAARLHAPDFNTYDAACADQNSHN